MSLLGNAIKRMTGNSAAPAQESPEPAVDHIVHTSVDDAKSSIAALLADESKSTEERLRILRAALEAEKEGQARSSLLTIIRSAIRSQEKVAEGEEEVLPVVYGAEADDDIVTVIEGTEGAPGEVIPPAPEESDESDLSDDDTDEPTLSGVADLSEFSIHPDLDRIAMMSQAHGYVAAIRNKDAAKVEVAVDLENDWTAFVDEIRKHGVREPIKVLRVPLVPDDSASVHYLIVDGRHRWQASQEAGLATIPFEIVEHSEARSIMEGTITARRNYTKAQKAFIAVLFHPELLEVKAGNPQFGINAELGISQGLIATKYGVGERTMRQAVEVARTMNALRGKYAKKVEAQEMEIWAGAGLPSVLSALKGIEATAGKPKPTNVSCGIAGRHLKGFAKVSADFAKWNQAEMMAFREEVAEFWDTVPDDFADFLTLVRVRDARKIEAIIAARELAKEEGAAQ